MGHQIVIHGGVFAGNEHANNDGPEVIVENRIPNAAQMIEEQIFLEEDDLVSLPLQSQKKHLL